MTTLAANKPRAYEGGVVIEENALLVIASDIIYEGAAVGTVDASGHARPLVGGDRFAGFANQKADNSAGAAAAISVDLKTKGKVQLAVTGAVTAGACGSSSRKVGKLDSAIELEPFIRCLRRVALRWRS